MSNDNMLSQEEIDALLNQSLPDEEEKQEDNFEQTQENGEQENSSSDRLIENESAQFQDILTMEEKDALGEVGNISMGSASTTLSELLGQRVAITSPKVYALTRKEFLESFETPYIIIQVEFSEGLSGHNILIMQLKDAIIMADLMIGGDGTGANKKAEDISDMEISAASEAMNQMIGTASTSLATMFSMDINIQPPYTYVVRNPDEETDKIEIMEDPIVVVSFKLNIEGLLDTEIMQVLSIETARSVASIMWESLYGTTKVSPPARDQEKMNGAESSLKPQAEIPKAPAATQAAKASAEESGMQQVPPGMDPQRLKMIMDIPLKVDVVLGRTQKSIKEVQGYTPGAILELSSEVEEPVEMLVNGILVARGEVVVVNENFGIRITEILSPEERVRKLTE